VDRPDEGALSIRMGMHKNGTPAKSGLVGEIPGKRLLAHRRGEGALSGIHNERVRLIRSVARKLVAEINKIAPMQVVSIKATVHEALFQKLTDASLPVVNEEPLPFPAAGWQNDFEHKLRSLVDTGRLRLCST
jgi:hypothetical protein